MSNQELQDRLILAEENRDTYVYNGERSLSDKTLVRLLGASGVGRSTITDRILELAPDQGIDAAKVGIRTTRHRRASDPENYLTADEGVTQESIIHQLEKGELVSWTMFETGDLYATAYESFPAEYNFLPCLPGSLDMQNRAGFKKLRTFYLVTTADAWLDQLDERRGPGFTKRLDEAMSSLEFAQHHQEMHKFESRSGDEALSSTALRIINFTKAEDYKDPVFGGCHERHIKDDDFDRRCREMYRLAIILTHEAA